MSERSVTERLDSLRDAPDEDRLRLAAHLIADGFDGLDTSILIWDDSRQRFVASASTLSAQESGYAASRVRSRGASDYICRHGKPVAVSDTAHDPFGANTMLLEHGLRAYQGAPLVGDDKTFGVIYTMARKARSFRDSEAELLGLLGVAIGQRLAS